MAQQSGMKSTIIYDEEDTFKSTPTTPDAYVLPFVSESLRLNRNLVESKVIRTTRNPSGPARGVREVAGDITLELNPTLGRIFRQTLGVLTTTSVGGVYSHTFKVGDLPQGMTIEKQFTGLATPKYFKYNGCKVNSMKITVKPEGMVEAVLNIMGAKETVVLAAFDATATDFGHIPFDGYEATITKDGTALGIVTELDISIENNLDGSVYVLDGSGERYSLPDGMVKVSGNLKTLFTDDILYAAALASTECKLVLTLTVGSGNGTNLNEVLRITIPELIFQPQAPTISGPTGILVELPFVAYYNNDVEVSTIKFELATAVASW
jgi:hypothetical protein